MDPITVLGDIYDLFSSDRVYNWIFSATLEPGKSGQGWRTRAGFPAGASSGILERSSRDLEHPEPQQTAPSSSLFYLELFGFVFNLTSHPYSCQISSNFLEFFLPFQEFCGMELPQSGGERNEVILEPVSFPSDPRAAPSSGDKGCPPSLWKFIPSHDILEKAFSGIFLRAAEPGAPGSSR